MLISYDQNQSESIRTLKYYFRLVSIYEYFAHSYFITWFKARVMFVLAFACVPMVALKQLLSSRQNQVIRE